MRFLIVFMLLFSSQVYSAGTSSCDNFSNNKCYYNSNAAVSYAINYAETSTSFYDFTPLGGNCTNFVSQAILAGLIGNSDKNYVYNKRIYYMADRDKSCDYCWFYDNLSSRGIAFTDASDLYDYAKSNLDYYWGMHFDFITNDDPSYYMDAYKVQEGDVIFADWQNNGSVDHTMIVTDKIPGNSYSSIKVAYQSNSADIKESGRTLSSINSQYNYNAVFYVYRPTFYRN